MSNVKIVAPTLALRRLFYLVTPNETSFATRAEVPNYVNESVPYFFVFIVLEAVICLLRGHNTFRWNDLFSSVAAGVQSEISKVVFRGVEFGVYLWLYDNHRLLTLAWDSPTTWWICFIGVDLGYYWFHRAAHEVNIIWAAHQVHHSSEDYNLTTALRQSTVQVYTSWIFYLPLALAVPPPVFLVHQQFNLLYQFWIHTEVVDKLGPLEYILNTPSHHRVHHGRNPYCIDKNYAGTLIIWDRMFGTFQEERDEVAYGLTHPLNTWDPIWTQVCHYVHIASTVRQLPGLTNKLRAVLYGPGWAPGKPRLGDPMDIPQVSVPAVKYDPSLPTWSTLYVVSHFMLTITGYQEIVARNQTVGVDQLSMFTFIIFIIYSLTCFGALFDNRWYAGYMECIRCAIYLCIDTWYTTSDTTGDRPLILSIIHGYFVISLLLWLVQCINCRINGKPQK